MTRELNLVPVAAPPRIGQVVGQYGTGTSTGQSNH
jgi:hypothetical protein